MRGEGTEGNREGEGRERGGRGGEGKERRLSLPKVNFLVASLVMALFSMAHCISLIRPNYHMTAEARGQGGY